MHDLPCRPTAVSLTLETRPLGRLMSIINPFIMEISKNIMNNCGMLDWRAGLKQMWWRAWLTLDCPFHQMTSFSGQETLKQAAKMRCNSSTGRKQIHKLDSGNWSHQGPSIRLISSYSIQHRIVRLKNKMISTAQSRGFHPFNRAGKDIFNIYAGRHTQ